MNMLRTKQDEGNMTGSGLGQFAPMVFGWMVGSKPIKVDTKKEK